METIDDFANENENFLREKSAPATIATTVVEKV